MVLASRWAGGAPTVTAVPPDLGALLRHRDAMYKVAASVLREVGRDSEAVDVVSEVIVSIMASPLKTYGTGKPSWSPPRSGRRWIESDPRPSATLAPS